MTDRERLAAILVEVQHYAVDPEADTTLELVTRAHHCLTKIRTLAEMGSDPLPVVLHCPACGRQHIDVPVNLQAGWVTPPHTEHGCAFCGARWRPAAIETVGVEALAEEEALTKG